MIQFLYKTFKIHGPYSQYLIFLVGYGRSNKLECYITGE